MEQNKGILQSEMFYISHLNPYSEKDLLDIDCFRVDRREGYGLEIYLKDYACFDEENHLMRTYLVRDIVTDEIAGYFSLKAGLISLHEQEEEIDEIDKETGIRKRVTKFDTRPGVELADFAVNSAYVEKYPWLKGVGYVIFSEFVLPMADKIAEYAGVNMVYIFALPEQDLIRRYMRYGFKQLSEDAEIKLHNRLKPRYDRSCKFMYQLL